MKADQLELPYKTYNLLQSWAQEKVPRTFEHGFHTALKESENSPKGKLKTPGAVPDDGGAPRCLVFLP